jgi:hypothetical protein
MSRSVNLLSLAVMLYAAAPTVSLAAQISYDIVVTVTSVPNSPGTHAPWTFGGLPAVFHGTFVADDTAVGPISSLALTIGGVDVAATHPLAVVNAFDPGTNLLNYVTLIGTFQSGVGFGSNAVAPVDYVVAADTSAVGPLDPYYGGATYQNWVATYAVTAVPEPGTMWLLAGGAGIFALAARRRRSAN